MAKPRAATSSDVAREAGVSRATVSMVLNGATEKSRVSAETRQRVLAAAAALGYAPHPLAQALRRRRSDTIGFVPRFARASPYEHPVPYLLGVQIAQAAIRRGFHIVEASAETTASRVGDALARFLLDRRVDGVILDSPETADEVARFAARGLPIVQLLRPQRAVAAATLTVDATPGIAAAIDHLVALGHRRIGFLGHGGAHPIDRSRHEAFVAALARHDLGVRGARIRLVREYSIAEGREAALALIDGPLRPTALFAAGDNLALGALQALYARRLRVPDDLSLISYDGVIAPHLAPPLTSVHQPLSEVAEWAVASIAAQLQHPDAPPSAPPEHTLPSRFVIRDSTAAPRP